MAKGKIAIGVVLGALVGVAAGVLTAPRSGKETRSKYKDKLAGAQHKVSEKVEEGKEKVTDATKRLRDLKDRQ